MNDATPESGADLLLPELLEPGISETIFAGGVHHFACIGSTNAAAMQAGAERWARSIQLSEQQSQGPRPHPSKGSLDGAPASQYAAHGANQGEVWLAEEQTAGKGRAGHTWQSRPRDGIYLSALLWPRLAPVEAPILSLVAGLAVVEAVHEVTGLWGDLRWPNDVLLGDKKFCGILAELSAGLSGDVSGGVSGGVSGEVERVRYVVVGIGLNVNNEHFPPPLEAIATSLRLELGWRVSRLELVAALLRGLDRELRAFEAPSAKGGQLRGSDGLAAARGDILRRFERHSSYCSGAAVTVEEDGGYQGTTRGLDESGFLRVETAGGMRTVLSGGVRKRPH